jgi:Glycosyltransferase family 87
VTWLAPRRAPAAVVALWLLTRLTLLVLALNPGLYDGAISGDVRGYGAKVERMFQGELPYRDVAIEYPPGSVPFTLLPALVAGTGAHYRFAFALTMLAVDAVGLLAAFRLGRATGGRRARVPLAYVLATAALGPIAYMRFDYVPAVCVLFAAAFTAERRPTAAAAALGFGTAAKLFPAVLAPLLVLGLVPMLGWRRALRRTVPAFTAALLVPVLPALLISARGTFEWVIGYHLDRGVQIESLWSNAILIAHHVIGLPASVGYEFGAFDLLSPWSPGSKALSGPVTLVALAGVAWLTWQRARRDGGIAPAVVPVVFAAGVLAFILPNRVLSPQYLVWVLPLLAGMVATVDAGQREAASAPPRKAPALRALWYAVVAALLTQVIFPFRYDQLRDLSVFDTGLLTVRNGLLVAAAAAVVAVLRWPLSSATSTAPRPGFRLSRRGAMIRESNIRSVDSNLAVRRQSAQTAHRGTSGEGEGDELCLASRTLLPSGRLTLLLPTTGATHVQRR